MHYALRIEILALIVVFCFWPTAINAAGIEVSPSRLDLQVPQNGSATVDLTTSNPTADVQLFEVYPDDFAGNIKAVPSSFTLESGSRKQITITVNAMSQAIDSVLATHISILAHPLADVGFQANTGVKIPLTARIVPTTMSVPKPWPRWVFWLYVAAVLAAFAVWRFFPRKNRTVAR